jgi:hypothetical protein
VIRDNVINSFTGRLSDAARTWDGVMPHTYAGGMYYAGPDSTPDPSWDVNVRYEDIGTALGNVSYTTRNNSAGGCAVTHSTLRTEIGLATVRLDPRSDWFTQDNSRRSYWENCSDNSYSCNKRYDAGSVFVHELGHTLGLHHPNGPAPYSVDAHIGNGDAGRTANCGNSATYASMCAFLTGHTTAWRTLDAYDVNSMNEHYQRNGDSYP